MHSGALFLAAASAAGLLAGVANAEPAASSEQQTAAADPTSPSEVVAEPRPANYRVIIKKALPTIFDDHRSLGDVAVLPPFRLKNSTNPGWDVCLLLNPKNEDGARTGLRAYIVTLSQGKVIGITPDFSNPDLAAEHQTDQVVQQLCAGRLRIGGLKKL